MKVRIYKEVDSTNLREFLSDIQRIVNSSGVPVESMSVEYQDDSTINICYQREMTEGERIVRERFLKQQEAYSYAYYLKLKERFEK